MGGAMCCLRHRFCRRIVAKAGLRFLSDKAEIAQSYADKCFLDRDLQHTLSTLKVHSIGLELYCVFLQCDTDRSGTISAREFFRFFLKARGAVTPFTAHIFELIQVNPKGDTAGEGELSFNEFVCGVWSFCTLDQLALQRAIWSIFDTEGVSELAPEELEALFRMIYGQEATEDRKTRGIISQFIQIVDNDHDGRISFEEFVTLANKQRALLRPVYTLQSTMRYRLCGNRFWADAAKRRKRLPFNTVDDILYKQQRLDKARQDEEKRLADEAKAARVAEREAHERRIAKEAKRLRVAAQRRALEEWREKNRENVELATIREAIWNRCWRERQLEHYQHEWFERHSEFSEDEADDCEEYENDNLRMCLFSRVVKGRQAEEIALGEITRIWNMRETKAVDRENERVRKLLQSEFDKGVDADKDLMNRLLDDAKRMSWVYKNLPGKYAKRMTKKQAIRNCQEEYIVEQQGIAEKCIRKVYAAEARMREYDCKRARKEALAADLDEAAGMMTREQNAIRSKRKRRRHWPPRPKLRVDVLPVDADLSFAGAETLEWAKRKSQEPDHIGRLKQRMMDIRPKSGHETAMVAVLDPTRATQHQQKQLLHDGEVPALDSVLFGDSTRREEGTRPFSAQAAASSGERHAGGQRPRPKSAIAGQRRVSFGENQATSRAVVRIDDTSHHERGGKKKRARRKAVHSDAHAAQGQKTYDPFAAAKVKTGRHSGGDDEVAYEVLPRPMSATLSAPAVVCAQDDSVVRPVSAGGFIRSSGGGHNNQQDEGEARNTDWCLNGIVNWDPEQTQAHAEYMSRPTSATVRELWSGLDRYNKPRRQRPQSATTHFKRSMSAGTREAALLFTPAPNTWAHARQQKEEQQQQQKKPPRPRSATYHPGANNNSNFDESKALMDDIIQRENSGESGDERQERFNRAVAEQFGGNDGTAKKRPKSAIVRHRVPRRPASSSAGRPPTAGRKRPAPQKRRRPVSAIDRQRASAEDEIKKIEREIAKARRSK